jgi:large-conductance mechanosensitive channel
MHIKKNIKKYGLIAITVSFVVGNSIHGFFGALIQNGIMPIFDAFLSGGSWKTHVISLGHYRLMWGEIVSEGLRLVLSVLVVFYLIDLFEARLEEPTKEE